MIIPKKALNVKHFRAFPDKFYMNFHKIICGFLAELHNANQQYSIYCGRIVFVTQFVGNMHAVNNCKFGARSRLPPRRIPR